MNPMSDGEADAWWKDISGVCIFPECENPQNTGGLCVSHYSQKRRTGSLKPIRTPTAGRVTVRLSSTALRALGDEVSKRAQEVIEAWAASR
jgi:hypothetical protein